ncbi:MAG: hypothetical protein ABJB98_10975, partial [Actinomycetota bacterium]
MSRLERLAPLTGALAMLLFVAEATLSGNTPDTNAPAHEVVSYWQDHHTQQQVAGVLFGLAAVAFVWFGASLRQALRRAEGDPGRLSSIAFAGTVIIAVGLLTYAGFGLAIADAVGKVPESVTQTLNVLTGPAIFITIQVGTLLMLLSVGISVLRHGGLPRWIGWVSIVLAVVAATPVGFLAFLALMLYLPTMGILI